MPNKIIKSDKGVVSVRIDNAYTTNEKHFVLPYTDPASGKERYFGSFKFLNPNEAKETLKEAIKQLGKVQDTIFAGQYPKWINDSYGTQLKVSGRVKFFKEINSTEEVPQLSIRNFIYSLEIHLTPTKDGGIYIKVARAIADRQADDKYADELFTEKVKKAATSGAVEVEDEDLPF
jgi:hypothetical protein